MADRKFRPETEVLCAADAPRRWHWSDADKIRIVEESFVGHRQVTATARRHDVSRSLLTTWRRQYRDGRLSDETSPQFIPLTVSPGTFALVQAGSPKARTDHPNARLEIVLRNERRLLVPATVDPETLARLLHVFEGS